LPRTLLSMPSRRTHPNGAPIASAGFFRAACKLTLGGAVLLAGCATYQPRPLSPADEANEFSARSLDAPALHQFLASHGAPEVAANWPLASWDLRMLTLAAWFNHPEMEIAQAKLAAAEAALTTAGVRPNPTIGFSPTYDADPMGGVSPWTLGFTLDWPIETAGKRGYRIAQAQHTANSARLSFAETVWQVRSRVRKSLTDLQGAMRKQEILTRQLATQNQAVTLLEARLKAGESSLTELQFVRIAAAQTALDLREGKKQTNEARIRLADALGVPPEALAGIAFDFTLLDKLPRPEEAGALRREALLNRADVLGALADYDASQSALQLEFAKQYPDLHLGPGYAWDQGENKFTLGISLTLPVFNRNRGPIAEAEAHRREAAAAFGATQAHAISEVELTFAGYRDALGKLETADALLSRQRQRVQSIERSFTAGAIDRLELLQSQGELGASELSRAAAFNEAQLALGALEDAMQRPAVLGSATDVPAFLLNRHDTNP